MPRGYIKKGGNGGRRPGAGRPKGAKSRKDSLLHVKSLREKYPVMPLEHWLTILNDEGASIENRCQAAFAAAPYVHRGFPQRSRFPSRAPTVGNTT